MAYTVIRTDLLSGTDVAADLVSLKFYDSGNQPAPIENGHVVKLAGLLPGERELWRAETPADDTPLDEIAIVAAVELHYDERKKNLDEFVTEADKAARGYIPRARNIFSVTKEGLTGKATPAVGDVVELAADTRLNVVATATGSSTQVGKIIEVEQTSRYTYYVIQIGA